MGVTIAPTPGAHYTTKTIMVAASDTFSLVSKNRMTRSVLLAVTLILVLIAPSLQQNNFDYIDDPGMAEKLNIMEQFMDLVKRGGDAQVYRRSCIGRYERCDHRPKDCCNRAACRCNWWGSNCRCAKPGLV